MQCVSCQTEIDPKWKHAIEQNVCPFCGSSILEEELKNLLTLLTDTMEQLQDYPDQLEDWLKSNYQYVKVSSQAFQEAKKVQEQLDFQVRKQNQKIKVKIDNKEEEVLIEKVHDQEATNGFFDRAEALNPFEKKAGGAQSITERTQQLRNLKMKAQTGDMPNAFSASLMDEEEGEYIENVDAALFQDLQQFSQQNPGIQSALIPELQDENNDVNRALAITSRMQAKQGNNNSSDKDLRYLEELQNRRAASQDNFNSGANRGKGGFSRA